MKFKRLLLHGFKSFVDKTVLDFPDGVTAVIGPNGSGKSNIMDAVRWVFGEQSAKELRGTDMDDVVFNGSAKRKPAGFAEVALTLSDIDDSIASKYGTFSDITITRKFYRSGEREYYINNRKCRLKDIKDIFMDTGLGARSISIIEQGKVDKIINASPEELRFFLEETAGVTKFKDKKKDAEKRLSQTRENLDRVNDIIKEVFERLESLSLQVEKLKVSEELQGKKRELDKQFLSAIYNDKITEIDRLNKVLDNRKVELTQIIQEHTNLMNLLASSTNLYNETETENKALIEKKLYASNSLTKAEENIRNLKERLIDADGQKRRIADDLLKEEESLKALEVEKVSKVEEAEAASRFSEEAQGKLDVINEVISDIKISKEQVDEEFFSIDKEYIEQTKQISDLRQEIIKREATILHHREVTEKLKKEKSEIEVILAKISIDINSLQDNIQKTSEDLKSQESKLNESRELHRSQKDEVERYRLKQSELNGTLKNIRSNIEFLNEQISTVTIGSSSDSKNLKRFKSNLLIDILKKYDKSKLVDISDVIVFRDEDYDEVIKTVADVKTSIKFTFNSKVDDIINMIEKRNLNLEEKKIFFSNGIFSKLGDDEKNVKIMKLKEKISQDSTQMEVIESELQESNIRLEELTQKVDEKSGEIASLEDTLRRTRDIYTKGVTELENLKINDNRNKSRFEAILGELKITTTSIDTVESDISNFTVRIESIAKVQAEAESKRVELEDKRNYISRELEEKKEEEYNLKVEFNKRNERAQFFKRDLDNCDERINSSRTTINNLRNRLDELVNVNEASWKGQLDELTETIKQLQINLLSTEEELKLSDDKLSHIRSELERYREDSNKKNNLIIECEKVIGDIKAGISGATSSIESVVQQYYEKFAVDISEEYRNHIVENFDNRKAREEIRRLELEIEKLGPINLNAVNDYNEADERYKFLTTQRTDIENSINDINTFISDTDGTTVELFEKTFNSVKEKFVDVFHILFGNGEAELRLTDPENILTSGVEIYIQPPGKKLQNMSLLSGGEKALTAMTLLFALFLQKPTPFCFLDEVDAPLDDANVERYINMVKALSDKTQFILITHNHNTMAVADSLYGVKMQESGVSSILSVMLDIVDKVGR